jgi:hypothetical protein
MLASITNYSTARFSGRMTPTNGKTETLHLAKGLFKVKQIEHLMQQTSHEAVNSVAH